MNICKLIALKSNDATLTLSQNRAESVCIFRDILLFTPLTPIITLQRITNDEIRWIYLVKTKKLVWQIFHICADIGTDARAMTTAARNMPDDKK
jgi:hypothetical protein